MIPTDDQLIAEKPKETFWMKEALPFDLPFEPVVEPEPLKEAA